MKNKHLVLIFLMLIVAAYFSRKQFGKRERSFETVLVQVDTSSLNTVAFSAPGEEEFSLTKTDGGWVLSDGRRSAGAEPGPVSRLLQALERIETRQIATKNKELWPVYGVDGEQGFRVRLYKGSKPTHDFFVGREDFEPNTQSIISYIRMAGENTVFVVDGFLTMHIGRTFDNYRNRVLLRMTKDMEVTEFSLEMPDTSFAFRRTPNGWILGGQVLDSMQVEDYLNVLRNISGEAYADDFDELQSDRFPRHTLTIRGKNIPEPFVVTCYEDTLHKPPFVFRSSQNPRAFFYSDSAGLFRQVVADVLELALPLN